MTYGQAMDAAAKLRPSEFSEWEMARWLCDLDYQLLMDYVAQYATQEQMDAVADGHGVEFGLENMLNELSREGTQQADMPAIRLEELYAVQAPYDNLYVDYLVMQIDLHNADYERYNNDAMLYASELHTWLNRLSRRNWHNLDKYDPQTGRMPTAILF